MLVKFVTWMEGVGGMNKPNQSQHGGQTLILWKAACQGGSNVTIEPLFVADNLEAAVERVKAQKLSSGRTRCPGTIASYLGSLTHFLEWVRLKDKPRAISYTHFQLSIDQIGRLIRSLGGDIKKRSMAKSIDDYGAYDFSTRINCFRYALYI